MSSVAFRFGLLVSKAFDETRDDSARLVACLLIPSRRSLLQHDEYTKGEVSTQYAQETFKRSNGTAHPRRHQRRMLKAAAERIGEEGRSMVPEFLQAWIQLMKEPAQSFEENR